MGHSKPTLVIVPGSFSQARFYNGLIEGLRAAGFKASIQDLPTTARKPGESAATLAEDTMFFNGYLTSLCEAGEDVVVLGHSYGGCVISGCVKGLTEKRDGKGRVVGLIYITALVPKVGESIGDLTSSLGFKFIGQEGEYLYHADVDESARVNFSALPQDEGVYWAKQLTYHSASSFVAPLAYAAYADVESIAYVLCKQDICLTQDFQRQMIEAAKGTGRPTEVYELDSDHTGPATRPENYVKVIKEIVEKQFM